MHRTTIKITTTGHNSQAKEVADKLATESLLEIKIF